MSNDMPAEAAFSLKVTFLRELDAGYKQAREVHDRLLRAPTDRNLIESIQNFFHKIAGTAHTVDLATLAYLCSVCENLGQLALDGKMNAPEQLAQLYAEGLAGVAAVLDEHGSGGNERPLPPGPSPIPRP